MYDSGAMQYDGDTGADFSDFQQGNMGGFTNMGSNGAQNFKFTMNGQDMGGIDPSEIFSMFMGGNRGGFGGFGQSTRGKSSNKANGPQNKFKGFGGFDGFGF